ncbi:MAG: hypothetical protein NTW85_00615 [Methylococcales bacterium]|nr:hypothetical protein [Methylococcales bacterium]
MSDNKNLPQKKDSAEVALQKTTSLLSITNKILANRANRTLVVSDDAWLDELIAIIFVKIGMVFRVINRLFWL